MIRFRLDDCMSALHHTEPALPASLVARHLTPLVRKSLQDTPAVPVNSPRQCGKTTGCTILTL